MAEADSQLPRALIDAYEGASYRANAGAEWVELRIGIPSRDLLNLYDRQGPNANIARSAAFITAWNPFSEERTISENAAANAAMEANLRSSIFLQASMGPATASASIAAVPHRSGAPWTGTTHRWYSGDRTSVCEESKAAST